jgi:hypothetical protein
MTLESWLERATRTLAPASTEKVRTEIRDHYESAFEAELARGASRENAERVAVESLGSAAAANREYRKVLLTAPEAKMLEFWKTPDPRIGRTYALLASAFLVGSLATVFIIAGIGIAQPESLAALPSPEKLSFLALLLSALCVGVSLFALQGWRRSNPGSKRSVIVFVLHVVPLIEITVAVVTYVYFGFNFVTRFWFGSALVTLMSLTASTWPINTPGRSRSFRLIKWAILFTGLLIFFWPWHWGILIVYIYGEWRRNLLRRKLPTQEWPPELFR